MLLTVASAVALAAWAAVLLLPWQPHRVRERLEAASEGPVLDDVTVLIPARNEAAVIERTLAALSRQGPGLDVIVVDDESDDGTAELCMRFCVGAADTGSSHPTSLCVVSGRPRPAGWSGKLWALEQGFERVQRPRVLLLDADIELAPGTIAALVEQSERTGADLVSIMATLRCRTFAERLLAPPFVFFFKLLYPFALANSPRSRVAAAAGGCILVGTEALRGLGGFAPLRGALIDDCTFAAALKGRGHRTWIGMSRSVRSLRPYGFGDFWRMVSRTAFTQLRYSPLLLLGTTAAMLLVFVAPVAALLTTTSMHTAVVAAAALAAMGLAYLPVVRFYALPAAWVLTLPLAGALFLGMTWDSAIRYWRGVRARWKDRAYGVTE
ncbi:MAG: glycosyltransferase [Gammaproteobacteria bacterium]|nr:glycosyltransferase [Gammaproteobacteria bacterium]